jgi:hypothetical protein
LPPPSSGIDRKTLSFMTLPIGSEFPGVDLRQIQEANARIILTDG